MMKVRHTYKGKEKIYEYPTTTILVNTETKSRIKENAKKQGMTIKDFVEQMITEYENSSN